MSGNGTGNGRGAIYAETAYAQGKMLDHSAWGGTLARNITPSDVDMMIDANGKILFCELSSSEQDWRQIATGQRLVYENAIKGGAHCACLCRHNVEPKYQIDTRNNIESFHVMLWDHRLIYSDLFPGASWPRFVEGWINSPNGALTIRHRLIGFAVGLIRPAAPAPSPPLVPSAGDTIGTGKQFEFRYSITGGKP